jgi:hypothetical protein
VADGAVSGAFAEDFSGPSTALVAGFVTGLGDGLDLTTGVGGPSFMTFTCRSPIRKRLNEVYKSYSIKRSSQKK